ncbi:MCM2/3/5 family-domain-containing protein [Glomus cerebriforme]|uniref:MCM2/3/5 family-domain-containing protein n=1 Tax=Glomus cerebriforme TaxID=658196 RepID=A0A397T218_9GLOM|nr:MCM2/3/5 family-domain-containing protein [Glomus cerebriforme]
MSNINQNSSKFALDYEPEISNVLQNTFVSRVSDKNDEKNQEPVISFNDLTENNIGKKVSIRGLVTHASGIKLLTSEVSFKCIECQNIQILGYNNGGRYYYFPLKCKSLGCKSKRFTPIIPTTEFSEKDENDTFSYLNKFRMQEVWNESENENGLPKVIDCEFRNNLVDKVKPGDFVAVKGKLQVHEISETNDNNKGNSMMHHLYIDTMDVKKVSIYDQYIGTASTEENMFSLRDLYNIKQVTITSHDLFKRIVNSYCSPVYGHELIKAGILLSIFGKDDNGAIHILLVGDPGTDKIELLLAVNSISPNTVFTPINRGDEFSILPTLKYDRYFNEWILEAGSLALSNKGICRIDDFEKIGKFDAFAETIDRKSFPVGKYGVRCSLKTQTNIIASANPIDGHYNKSKTLSENLKISNALLSNFDLVFLLLDAPDEEMDRYLSERVMTVHSGLYPEDESQRYVPAINRNQMTDIPLSERLKYGLDDENMEILPIELLKKYVAYAHKYVHPRLSEEARLMIKLFYINMGHKYLSMCETNITIRQLESLIRLAQARARMELRDIVTCSDVEDVAEIVEFCLFRIQRDEFGNSRSRKGRKLGMQNEARRFLGELQKQENAKGSDIFTMQEMQQIATDYKIQCDNFQGFIDYLNEQSLLLKKGPGTFQLRT